jgi:hypothetical protein
MNITFKSAVKVMAALQVFKVMSDRFNIYQKFFPRKNKEKEQ